MRFIGLLAASLFAASAASAATIPVTNGDFEDSALALNMTFAGVGSLALDMNGYDVTGGVATYSPAAGIYQNVAPGSRVGIINGDDVWGGQGTISQNLGVTIESGVSYTLSALLGNRLDYTAFGGVAGFFAGDPSNIIAQSSKAAPGENGMLEAQSFAFDALVFESFVGQTLGFFFTATGYKTQITIDNISVAWQVQQALDLEKTLVNPIPGAAWLFGTALFAGAAARRRKKALA
ncbi:MAG: hypothetical protein RIE56_03170 [Amphiplicatus sp.]